jgi:hypothetical protein
MKVLLKANTHSEDGNYFELFLEESTLIFELNESENIVNVGVEMTDELRKILKIGSLIIHSFDSLEKLEMFFKSLQK